MTTRLRRRMGNGAWRTFHRLTYLGFVVMFLHAVLSGTDLAWPVISAMTLAAAFAVGYDALERASGSPGTAKARA